MRSHASFKRADVEDARRGYPAQTLDEFAQARGLEAIGQRLVGHVTGLNPLWQEYVFNVLRGEVVPGRFGTVQHELHEVSLGDDGSPGVGEFHSLRVKPDLSKKGLKRAFSFKRMVGIDEPPNEPFAAHSLWVPTTGVKLLVPEAALLPKIVALVDAHSVVLQPRLAPNYKLVGSRWIDDELRADLSVAMGPALAALRSAFVRVQLSNGQLGVRVDGYRSTAAELDPLIAATGQLATALAKLAGRFHEPSPRSFDAPLQAFDRSTHPPGFISFEGEFDSSGMVALDRDAKAFGLTVEDPAALHRRFPRLAVPGTSRGLLAGTIPGTNTFGRLTFNTQMPPGNSAWLRRAAIIAAPPGTNETPPGGIEVPEADAWLSIRDGLACAWPRAQSPGKLDTAQLAEQAVATYRAAGISV